MVYRCTMIFLSYQNTGTEILTLPNSSQHTIQHAMKHQLCIVCLYIYRLNQLFSFLYVHGCLQISVVHEPPTTFPSGTQRKICLHHYTTLYYEYYKTFPSAKLTVFIFACLCTQQCKKQYQPMILRVAVAGREVLTPWVWSRISTGNSAT